MPRDAFDHLLAALSNPTDYAEHARARREVIMRVVFGVTHPRTRGQLAPRLNRIVDISPIILLGSDHIA